MNVEAFVLCRETKQVINSVDIIGIFNLINSPTIPFQINNRKIVLRLNFSNGKDDAGIHTINISLKDKSGNILKALSDSISVDFDGHPGYVMDLVYELTQIELPKHGDYTFNLSVDDKQVGFIPLCLSPNI